MKTKNLLYLSALSVGLSFTSCKEDVPEPDNVNLPNSTSFEKYDNGVFVTNEGPYATGTGTLSFYDPADKEVDNEIFNLKNAYTLGNIVQSMYVHNTIGYIVVNNADKIEVVDGSTIESKGVISGLSKPRYFLGVDANTGYVSQWGASTSSVEVIDLNTKAVKVSIPTASGAENMAKMGDKVYVACGGGYGTDSIVNVINTTTNTVVKSIVVGAAPQSIQVDANGDVWVLCVGKWKSDYSALEISGSLERIDGSGDTVNLSLAFSSTFSQPSNLVINSTKNKLFYSYDGGVYSHDITSSSLSSTSFISRKFYGLGVDPSNDEIYGGDAGNFTSKGKVIRYSATGTVIDSFGVGIAPNGFFFN